MTAEEFAQQIRQSLPFLPNEQQEQVIGSLARFCSPKAPDDAVFLLNGYAGTGKTSICAALVRSLQQVGISSVLLAPTGRAAKVFARYAQHPAYTIHRKIYKHAGIGQGETGRQVRENTHKRTIFIVDEASMVTGLDYTGSDLLEDLIHYVYTGDNCKLILLGDRAQLPPVGSDKSPAMDADTLRQYGLRVTSATLTATARQGRQSAILKNATWLRRAMRADPLPQPKLEAGGDVEMLMAEDMAEALYSAYSRDGGIADAIVITRSNQRAAAFNREIRASVLYLEEEIAPGELLIVAKNNYHWASETKALDFIANGDVLMVDRVLGTESRYGLRFADVQISLPDAEVSLTAKIMLDTLGSDAAQLSREVTERLYYSIMEDPELFDAYTPAEARLRALKSNPYWNALQVKYGYAVTCHKAQGGEWSNVFVDMGYIPPEAMGLDFYRWLYTAVSRARKRLYIVGYGQG